MAHHLAQPPLPPGCQHSGKYLALDLSKLFVHRVHHPVDHPLPQTAAAEEDTAVTSPQVAEAEDTRGQWTSWGFCETFGWQSPALVRDPRPRDGGEAAPRTLAGELYCSAITYEKLNGSFHS